MSIFQTPYDTLYGSHINIKEIYKSIAQAFATRDESEIRNTGLSIVQTLDFKAYFITGLNKNDENIIPFEYPMQYKKEKERIVITDIRQFIKNANSSTYGRIHSKNMSNYITNKLSFDLSFNRTLLQVLWLSDKIDVIKEQLDWASIIFTVWLSRSISNIYGLNPEEFILLQVITYAYYQSLFYRGSELPNELKLNMIVKLRNNLGIGAEYSNTVLEKLPEINGITDYCNIVKSMINNISLKDLTPVLLLNKIANSWFAQGVNAKGLLAVSLEHPPTWIAIVYQALNERTFKNTTISNIVNSFSDKNRGDNFNKGFEFIINEYGRNKEFFEDSYYS